MNENKQILLNNYLNIKYINNKIKIYGSKTDLEMGMRVVWLIESVSIHITTSSTRISCGSIVVSCARGTKLGMTSVVGVRIATVIAQPWLFWQGFFAFNHLA